MYTHMYLLPWMHITNSHATMYIYIYTYAYIYIYIYIYVHIHMCAPSAVTLKTAYTCMYARMDLHEQLFHLHIIHVHTRAYVQRFDLHIIHLHTRAYVQLVHLHIIHVRLYPHYMHMQAAISHTQHTHTYIHTWPIRKQTNLAPAYLPASSGLFTRAPSLAMISLISSVRPLC